MEHRTPINDPTAPYGALHGAQHEVPHGVRAVDTVRRAGRAKLVVLFVLFLLPVVASYLAYYVFPSQQRTNYGDLIDPQRDVPDAAAVGLDGKPVALSALRGRWMLLTVDSTACERACTDKLWMMRQVRLTTGKDRDRIERVWLVTDSGAVRPELLAEFDGTVMARTDAAAFAAALPVDAQAGTQLTDHVWVIDPLGHVMMRFPKQADPNKVKKDVTKLLKVSRIG